MSNTFTAQELADFYQKVADGGEAEFNKGITIKDWRITDYGPSNGSVRQDWRIKPTKKVIDLSVLIDSQIDCEFKDDISERITIGKLQSVYDWYISDEYPYKTGNSRADGYGQCQPRRNHKHAWQGGECPLPEGFEVKVWYRDDSRCTDTLMNSGVYKKTGWVHKIYGRDIIAFEVLGLADGYVMPWEKDND